MRGENNGVSKGLIRQKYRNTKAVVVLGKRSMGVKSERSKNKKDLMEWYMTYVRTYAVLPTAHAVQTVEFGAECGVFTRVERARIRNEVHAWSYE